MDTRDAGRLGAQVRHSRPLKERRRVALKAAATRKAKDPDTFKKMGMAGALALHSKTADEVSSIMRRSAITRKKQDPKAFTKMGRLGGKARWS